MAMDFSKIKFEVIDITTNSTPDLYINQNGVTFTKRVLEDMNYPQTVQYSISAEHKVFAVRVCKSNESKATPFSKPRGEQGNTLVSGSKNLHEILKNMVDGYKPKMRYKIVGYWDSENRVMYFDMSTAEESLFRAEK